MQFKKTLVAFAAAMATAVAATPAGAITNGQPDEGRHPWVGALVSHDPETGDKYLICSGTLIAPKVFLTAAHCLQDEPSDLYVSFDSFVGAPDVGPEVDLYHGQAHGHPEFVDSTAPGDTHDIAVVVLDERVRGIRPADLPTRRTLDRLDRHELLDDIPWGVVGYGREGYDPSEDAFFGGGTRFFGTSSFGSLEEFKLNLVQAPPDGGTCNGDSGGPILLGGTRTVVGISSDGDPLCQQTSVNYRTDTSSARKFLKRFVRRSRQED